MCLKTCGTDYQNKNIFKCQAIVRNNEVYLLANICIFIYTSKKNSTNFALVYFVDLRNIQTLNMSTKFYISVITNERETFNVNEAALKKAAIDVARSYNQKALKKGSTYLDYNNAANRCAYIYKYADVHTGLVTKYFRKLIKKKNVKHLLESKKNLKICCLGGGPGTDIIGIFRALAIFPAFHQKVSEVTVLDICGGWRNSFKRIISSIKEGKVKEIPENFIDEKNFVARLTSVDLLGPLPQGVVDIISNADIICMVKFVSAVLGKPESISALQIIGQKFKLGSVILFIDNFQGNVSKSVEDISSRIGLEIALGPLHEKYVSHKGKANKEVYDCLPQSAARVSVVGYVKKILTQLNPISVNSLPDNILEDDNDDGWNTDSDEDESFPPPLHPMKPMKSNVELKDQFSLHHDNKSIIKSENLSNLPRAETMQIKSEHSGSMWNQTKPKSVRDETSQNELELLVASLEKLRTVLEKLLERKHLERNTCCCCCCGNYK